MDGEKSGTGGNRSKIKSSLRSPATRRLPSAVVPYSTGIPPAGRPAVGEDGHDVAAALADRVRAADGDASQSGGLVLPRHLAEGVALDRKLCISVACPEKPAGGQDKPSPPQSLGPSPSATKSDLGGIRPASWRKTRSGPRLLCPDARCLWSRTEAAAVKVTLHPRQIDRLALNLDSPETANQRIAA
jgi:hypothetical protein